MASISSRSAASRRSRDSRRREDQAAQSEPRGGAAGAQARQGRAPRARHPSRPGPGGPGQRSPHGRRGGGRRRRAGSAAGDVGWERRVKCRKCGAGAVIELPRHNAAFCTADFLEFFRKQVAEAIRKHRMLTVDEPVLVAVSGGKDSLALWDVLIESGYTTAGLYLDLGIFDYSVESKAKCETFAASRGQKLIVETVSERAGASIPEVQRATRRPTCSACGLSKRYLM